MSVPLIESVPNFSIGQDITTVMQIADAFQTSTGIQLLHIDSDKDTNRTVYTVLGEPENLLQAFHKVMSVASKKIDMRQHKGVHPRIGACDVCPFIPFKQVTKNEAVVLSKRIANLFWDTFHIPSYLYGWSAQSKNRVSLVDCRKGEYENLETRLTTLEGKPDIGEAYFSAQHGLSIIGARDFLIAYNINVTGITLKQASKVAATLRTSGSLIKEQGKLVRCPGLFDFLQSRAWYLENSDQIQITTNVLNFRENSLFSIYKACEKEVYNLGGQVTASHIVGMLPLVALQKKEWLSLPITEQIEKAIAFLKLDQYEEFNAKQKILDLAI